MAREKQKPPTALLCQTENNRRWFWW